jgi:hypothetical protein
MNVSGVVARAMYVAVYVPSTRRCPSTRRDRRATHDDRMATTTRIPTAIPRRRSLSSCSRLLHSLPGPASLPRCADSDPRPRVRREARRRARGSSRVDGTVTAVAPRTRSPSATLTSGVPPFEPLVPALHDDTAIFWRHRRRCWYFRDGEIVVHAAVPGPASPTALSVVARSAAGIATTCECDARVAQRSAPLHHPARSPRSAARR